MRLLLAAVAASVLASCSGRPAAFYGTTMRSVRATDFTLVRQDGRPFRLADQRGKEVVLFFGYTHCPDVSFPARIGEGTDSRRVHHDRSATRHTCGPRSIRRAVRSAFHRPYR